MSELSPAAEAVLNAALPVYDDENLYVATMEKHAGMISAAAIKAVADQVVLWQPEPTEDSVGPTIDYGYAWALFSKANDIRQELIAIADELEAQ